MNEMMSKKMVQQEEINKVLIKELQSEPLVEFAYLFGSYADGTYNNRSDVDVAVYLKESDFDTQLKVSFNLSRV